MQLHRIEGKTPVGGGTSVTATEPSASQHQNPNQFTERIAVGIEKLVVVLARIADRLDPQPSEIIDSPTLAKRIGCTTTWTAAMARNGTIPKNCIVAGTGIGKPWKFHAKEIDDWLATR